MENRIIGLLLFAFAPYIIGRLLSKQMEISKHEYIECWLGGAAVIVLTSIVLILFYVLVYWIGTGSLNAF